MIKLENITNEELNEIAEEHINYFKKKKEMKPKMKNFFNLVQDYIVKFIPKEDMKTMEIYKRLNEIKKNIEIENKNAEKIYEELTKEKYEKTK